MVQNYEIIMNYELLIMNYFVSLHAKCLKMLELKDASLTIDGRQLFSRLSLMAMNGQVTCITGGRGTGKTALLQVMLGLLPLDEGLVSVDGELLTPLSAPVFRRMIAYVPQRREVMISQPDVTPKVWKPYGGHIRADATSWCLLTTISTWHRWLRSPSSSSTTLSPRCSAR